MISLIGSQCRQYSDVIRRRWIDIIRQRAYDLYIPTCIGRNCAQIRSVRTCNLKRSRGRGAPRSSIRHVLCRKWDGKIEVRPHDRKDLRGSRNIATLPFLTLAAQTVDENPNNVLPYDYYSRLCRDKVVEYSQCCWNRPLRLQLRGLALNDSHLFEECSRPVRSINICCRNMP